MTKETEKPKVITINLTVSHSKEDKPIILFRKKQFSDIETIKGLLSAAFWDRPVIIYPQFSNKFKALGTLQEKGLIYLDDNKEYRFTF